MFLDFFYVLYFSQPNKNPIDDEKLTQVLSKPPNEWFRIRDGMKNFFFIIYINNNNCFYLFI
jgi:hypothetical protein